MRTTIRQVTTHTVIMLSGLMLLLGSKQMKAQSPCMPTVPSYTIDLTGQPSGIWSSPNVSRKDQCCSATSPDQCIYFYLKLDTNAAGIQIDMIGADPAGSLFYDIDCFGSYPGGQIKCISGAGPYKITFCKPGGNKNVYKISSISRPLFPKDDTVRIGCHKKLVTQGIVNNSTIWQSIYPGTPGQYNSYLDSTNVASPTYTPASGAPAYVDYKVCGFPIASGCGFNFTVCDTVRVYNYPVLSGVINPNPASYCNIGSGSGVTLTGAGSGGLAPYTYSWYNSSNVLVGSGTSYFATASGNYNVVVKDKLYNAATCPAYYTTVSVTEGTIPVTDAGTSKKVCADNPTTTLNGSIQYATGGIWSGGTGTFNPGNNYLVTSYTPSAVELSAGFAKLYLTSTGSGGGCVNTKDSVIIYYSPTVNVTIPPASLACNNSTTILSTVITGGTAPYTYFWNTGEVTSTITAGQGVYSVVVTDSVGCTGNTSQTLVAPNALALNFITTDASTNGGSDGDATVSISGGTAPYSILWSPGSQTTSTITGLSYGIYTASITDNNGCSISGSTVVNEPRCLGFSLTTSYNNVSCYGSTTGSATVTPQSGTYPFTYSWNTSPAQIDSIATNLNAGVYTVIVEDANLCSQTANIVITEPTLLTNYITHSDVTVIGGNNGSATANTFGGSSPYNYLWSNGGSTATITNLTAGTYTLGITDNSGCVKQDSVNITQPPCNNLTINVVTSDVSCFNGKNGSALAVIGGASGAYTISWSTGSVGNSINSLGYGNYSVQVTDSKNCTEFIDFTISQPSQLSVGLSETDISCFGRDDGTIELTVSGGTFPYTFAWNNGSTSEDLVSLAPGTYSVSVSDAHGCTTTNLATIHEPTQLQTSYTTQNVTCIYGSNGSIDLTVSGGIAPYSYSWSNGATTQDISGLNAGGYVVNITDANFCTINSPIIIPISQPDSVKVDSFLVACTVPGSGKTNVTVFPSGGYSGTYQVSFNNGTSYNPAGVYTALLTNGNTYNVVLKDGNGCTSLSTATLSINNETKIDSIVFNKCYSTGTINTPVTVYASGGAGSPYSMSTNNGGSYLAPGTLTSNLNIAASYTVLVQDNRGCISAPSSITLPAVFTSTTSVTSNYHGQNISCKGSNDGAASVSVSGGTTTYSYAWSTTPAQTTASASSLIAGTYTVNISDANNCAISNTITLTEPDTLAATVTVTSNYNGQNISCFGVMDGEATAVPGGGTSPYTYSWNTSPAQNGDVASGLGAGTYSVVVKDINNCSYTSSITLTQPTTLTSTTSVTSNYNGQSISCNGMNDGSANVAVSGGTGSYTYSWTTSPVQTTADATGLTAGAYTVNITDANNCSTSNSAELAQPVILNAIVSVSSNYNGQNISCFGLADGEATVVPAGGTAPYTYSWNTTPAQITAVASGLVAGTYSVTVNDVNNCTITKSITLTQPTALSSAVSVTSNYNGQDVSCNGSNDGTAHVNITGGTGEYTYTWNTSPAQSTSTANNLSAGGYTVSVADINNCLIIDSVTLTEPTSVAAIAVVSSDYNGQNISCFGVKDGEATVTPSGGTSPYTYIWGTSPIQNDSIASGLGAGTYTVVVKDVNNCSYTTSVTLSQPTALTSTVTITSNYNGQNISCNGLHDGMAFVNVNGGTGSYTYLWSTTPPLTTPTATGLGAGTYSVQIADINNCTASNTVTLTQPDPMVASAFVSSNYNGADVSCYGMADGEATSTIIGGTGPYTYLWSTTPAQNTAVADSLPAAPLFVIISDINLCATTANVELTNPPQLIATIFDVSDYNGYNISCNGSTDGNIDIQVSGGTGAYNYLWSNNATTQDVTGIGAGNYSVTVTDINGCNVVLNDTLTEPTALTLSVDSITNYNGYNISCHGATNGGIYITANGGVSAYSFIWSNNTSAADLINVAAGTYSLVVTDQNYCKIAIDTTLSEPTALSLTYTSSNPLCNGFTTGSIDASLTGGVTPYNYIWSNGSTSEDISNLAAGSYSLTSNDNNNCITSISVIISEPAALSISKNSVGLKCYGDTVGNINITPAGGTLPYAYLWSNGAITQDLTNIHSGTYDLILTDANSCVLYDTTVISQPDSLTLTLTSPVSSSGYNIALYNGTDGSIASVVNGGTSPYTYLWSNGSTDDALSSLNAGNYSLTVADDNGCIVFGEIVLTQPLILEMPEGFSPNHDDKNDLFVVHGIDAYPNNTLTIYNRWGNIVYTKNEYKNEWEGISNNGQELPVGTYFAILEVNNGEIVLKGYVELKR